jgi:hypothetical protein
VASEAASAPDAKRQPLWFWIAVYGSIAILAAFYLFPFVRVLRHNGDEAISVLNAARVLQGELPARDFVEVIGPGEFYWLAAFFKLFGTTIGTARAELLLTGVAISVLTSHLARHAGAGALFSSVLVTSVSIPLFAINSYHWDSDLFALLAFAALLEWQKSLRFRLLFVSGAFAAACTLIMQQKGLLLCGALLLSAFLMDRSSWKKSFRNILAPYLGILAAVVIFYLAQGALYDSIWANIIWPVFRYSDINKCAYGFPLGKQLHGMIEGSGSALPAYAAAPIVCFALLPLLTLVGAPGLLLGAAAFFRRKVFLPQLVPFWICGFTLWLSELQRPDMIHLAFGSPLLLVLLAALLGMHSLGRYFTAAALISAALFAGGMLDPSLAAKTRLETRRGIIYSKEQDRALEFLQAHTHPGEEVFIYPYDSMYNFLSNTRNPTRFSYLVYGWHTPEQFQEAVDSLEAKQVKYVLWDTTITAETMGQLFSRYTVPSRHEQVIERYLEAHYRQTELESGWRIMERIQ